MKQEQNINRELLSPPGDTIQETIETINMSQAELALRMGRPKEKLNQLISGKEPLTRKTALQLERVLGIPVNFWINRENAYREELMRIEQDEYLQNLYHWALNFPINDLFTHNYLGSVDSKNAITESLLKFFSIATPLPWELLYNNPELNTLIGKLINNINIHSYSAWIRIAEVDTDAMKLPDFDKKAARQFQNSLKTKRYSIEEIMSNLSKAGIAVVVTPLIADIQIEYLTRWYHKSPVIQINKPAISTILFQNFIQEQLNLILMYPKRHISAGILSTSQKPDQVHFP